MHFSVHILTFPDQPQPLWNFSSSLTLFAVAEVPAFKVLLIISSPINRSLSGTFPPRSLCSLWRRFLRGSVDRGGFRMYRICQFDCLINNNQQVTAAWVFLNLQPRTGLPKSSAEWLTKAGRAGNRQVCRPAPYKCLLPAAEFLRSRDKRIGLTKVSHIKDQK